MSSTTQAHTNFGFLMEHSPLLHKLGLLAEKYYADDPSTVRILSEGPEPGDALNAIPWLKALRNAKNFKKICELNLLHSDDLIRSSSDYSKIRKLSDSDLLNSVNKPTNKDFLTINKNTGNLVDGNTRAFELQRRAQLPGSSITLDTQVPVIYHNP